jgi:hypothetical protein
MIYTKTGILLTSSIWILLWIALYHSQNLWVAMGLGAYSVILLKNYTRRD